LPGILLRFFSEEEHARQFVAGKVRFGILEYYRGIEDKRRDANEGRSSVYYKAPHLVHATCTSLNRYYILCTAHPEASIPSLMKKYGRFVVRIDSPIVLLERIKASWQIHDLAVDRGAFVTDVEYTKDELREPDPYFRSPPHLVYSQKPRSDEDDREYRYLVKCKVDVKRAWENHLTLTLPGVEIFVPP
jgi:hypothetical protein